MFPIAKFLRHVTPSAGICPALGSRQDLLRRAAATQHMPAASVSHRLQRHAALHSNAASLSRADTRPGSGVCRGTATGVSEVQLTFWIELRYIAHRGHACDPRPDMCRQSCLRFVRP
jgi:hypothetical protein